MKMTNTLVALATLVIAAATVADDGREDNKYLGQLSANPYDADSVSNPYGVGSPYDANSINNPYGTYGSPYSNKSVSNPYATEAPKLYDDDGNYRGRLSSNPYDAESVSNPYGKYGSQYSADSINNPYGAGNPYRADSPTNPYGKGIGIYDSESDGPDVDDEPAVTITTPEQPAEAPEPVYTFGWPETNDE